jgi:hypothetical protein
MKENASSTRSGTSDVFRRAKAIGQLRRQAGESLTFTVDLADDEAFEGEVRRLRSKTETRSADTIADLQYRKALLQTLLDARKTLARTAHYA